MLLAVSAESECSPCGEGGTMMAPCCSVLTCMADARAGAGREQHSVRQPGPHHSPQGARLS